MNMEIEMSQDARDLQELRAEIPVSFELRRIARELISAGCENLNGGC